MTTSPPPTAVWSAQREQYAALYAAQLPLQLRRVTALVHTGRVDPQALAPHFDSCLALLDRTAAPGLAAPWLDLVAALHPLPLRWQRWEEWGRILRQAAAHCAALGDLTGQAHYLAEWAGLLRLYGRLDETLATARQALALAGRARAIQPLAAAGATAVAALRFLGRAEQAAALLDDVQRQFDELAPQTEPETLIRPQTLLELQRMDLLRSTGDLPAAEALAARLAAPLEADPAVDPHFLATVLRRRATIYWAASRYEASAADLQRSAHLFQQAGDPLEALFSQGNLGLVYYSMARYDQAETHIREVIAAAEAMNAQWRLIRDVGNLAAVHFARGELDAALSYARRHLDLARRFSDGAEQSRAESNYTAARMYLGQAAEALPQLHAVYERFLTQERPEGYLSTLADLAVAYYLLGDSQRSRDHAARIFAHAATPDYPAIHILGLRARALSEAPAQAAGSLRQALELARQHGRSLDQAACLLSLAGLAADHETQQTLWHEGVSLLAAMGATAWLNGRSPTHPPLIAYIL